MLRHSKKARTLGGSPDDHDNIHKLFFDRPKPIEWNANPDTFWEFARTYLALTNTNNWLAAGRTSLSPSVVDVLAAGYFLLDDLSTPNVEDIINFLKTSIRRDDSTFFDPLVYYWRRVLRIYAESLQFDKSNIDLFVCFTYFNMLKRQFRVHFGREDLNKQIDITWPRISDDRKKLLDLVMEIDMMKRHEIGNGEYQFIMTNVSNINDKLWYVLGNHLWLPEQHLNKTFTLESVVTSCEKQTEETVLSAILNVLVLRYNATKATDELMALPCLPLDGIGSLFMYGAIATCLRNMTTEMTLILPIHSGGTYSRLVHSGGTYTRLVHSGGHYTVMLIRREKDTSGTTPAFVSTYFDSNSKDNNLDVPDKIWKNLFKYFDRAHLVRHWKVMVDKFTDLNVKRLLEQYSQNCAFHVIAFVHMWSKLPFLEDILNRTSVDDANEAYRTFWAGMLTQCREKGICSS